MMLACGATPEISKLVLVVCANSKAAGVTEYLGQLGDADIRVTNLPLDEQSAQAFVGDYVPDGAPDVTFHIRFSDRIKMLTFQRDDYSTRRLLRESDSVFTPGGAAGVRITFEGDNGRASVVSIADGELRIKARRPVGG